MDATLRRATEADLLVMAHMAGTLVRFHNSLDPERFFTRDDIETGYASWFRRELTGKDAILTVAEVSGEVVGYVYGRVEERDWNMLLGRHAALHDLFVREGARGRGIAESLVKHFLAEARARKAPQVVLHTASKNQKAQDLFARLGFRPTMLEMTIEAPPAAEPVKGA